MNETKETKRESGNEGKSAINRNGVNRMKSRSKLMVTLALAALMAAGGSKVWASHNSSTDSIRLLVTPSVTLAVDITSPTAGTGYDFSTVGLGLTTAAGTPATVTNTGNTAALWMLRAETDGTTWSTGTATALDVAVLQAMFTQPGSTIAASAFDTVDSTMTGTNRLASDSAARFSTGSTVMGASIPASGADSRRLWFRMKTPTESSTSAQQQFRVYVVAANP